MSTPLIFLNKIILMKTDENLQNQAKYELCDLRPSQAIDILLNSAPTSHLFHISLDDPQEEVKTLVASSVFEKISKFKTDEFYARTIHYDISTSIALDSLSDEQLNAWMQDAYKHAHQLDITLEINTDVQGSPILIIHGSIITSRADIMSLQLILIELSSMTSAALWVTEIYNGEETIINYKELAQLHSLWRKVSPEQN